jgi:hypothetical protein
MNGAVGLSDIRNTRPRAAVEEAVLGLPQDDLARKRHAKHMKLQAHEIIKIVVDHRMYVCVNFFIIIFEYQNRY